MPIFSRSENYNFSLISVKPDIQDLNVIYDIDSFFNQKVEKGLLNQLEIDKTLALTA